MDKKFLVWMRGEKIDAVLGIASTEAKANALIALAQQRHGDIFTYDVQVMETDTCIINGIKHSV